MPTEPHDDRAGLVVGRPTTLAPGVQRLLAPNPSPMTGPGTNSYVIGGPASVIVDPGPEDATHLETLAALAGPDVQAICLTHRHVDHAAGAMRLAAMTGAPVRAGPKPVAAEHDIELTDCQPLADGERLVCGDVRLSVHHSPGHAADHVVFLVDDTGLLVAGDTLMQAATVVILPPDGHMGAYLATLDGLADLAPATIAPAHGGLIATPIDEITRVRAHRLMREAQIHDCLSHTPKTPEALVARLYPELESALVPVAARQVLAHLIYLAEQGRAQEHRVGWCAPGGMP